MTVPKTRCLYVIIFQTRGNGNCLFHALKGCLKLRNPTDKKAPYFPCRYLRRMLVAHMAHNRDLMWKHKEPSLRGRYGLEGGDDCPEPISFKEYLQRMLKRGQWGDDIVLHAFASMCNVRVTVVNAARLEEYRIRHNITLSEVDVVLIFNGRNHYSYTGK